ncbi:MAG: glycosyltransferase family 9 protein [Alphaproteobacteria bacterium]
MTRILVIKLGALGDFVLAMGPFAAIRRHHPGAHVTLLTIASLADLAQGCGYFDEVWIDSRPPLWRLKACFDLVRRLNAAGFDRVYDLQTADRSNAYFHAMGPLFGGRRVEWSGIARGCSHRHDNPLRGSMHTVERQAEQLAIAGIKDVPFADLGWAQGDVSRLGLGAPYALLVPGGSPHRPRKRWPVAHFTEAADWLVERDVVPVLLGGAEERGVLDQIARASPGARNLCAETSLADIITLARGARSALGNDTGPMHLIAAVGCPTVVLFSAASDPALCAPRAPQGSAPVTILRREPLSDLDVDQVTAALSFH